MKTKTEKAAYAREWRKRNRERFQKYSRDYRAICNARHKEYIYAAKSSCNRCGNLDKRVLQFHHRDPATKSFPIADHVGHLWSLEKLIAEVAKCDVLCANCHIVVEWEKRHNNA